MYVLHLVAVVTGCWCTSGGLVVFIFCCPLDSIDTTLRLSEKSVLFSRLLEEEFLRVFDNLLGTAMDYFEVV